MDKINVLVVEDTPSESDALITSLEANNFNVVGLATNFKDAISLYNSTNPDVLIVDIFLNGLPEGINVAEVISVSIDNAKPFVFLTSSTDRQIFERAKLTKPFSYLLKPFNELELFYAIEMALEKFYEQKDVFLGDGEDTVITEDYLFIKKGRALKKVLIKDIIYIEVEDKYCNIITEKEKFVINISLVKISKLLNPNQFFRTHRRCIVNVEKVEQIILSDNLILLSGGLKADLSDNYREILQRVKTL
ncbi:LytR/AlgR family response regulator transcription factor [Winogradskyella jejuensis]|uniref:Two component transcriptional regulator, LytTR family n=1 Tax=Winogradskyella jejuensis TaxID=1089305 RepID=A0A1M5LAG7_9FLAO|nr:response regulator transcription factor [Winogradskyella jejuensis]SHG62007.1 two component transcriptional regulator, LytTR family [Winogradskyella jejuensis]